MKKGALYATPHGHLDARQIASIAGITPQRVRDRIRAGLTYSRLTEPAGHGCTAHIPPKAHPWRSRGPAARANAQSTSHT